VEAALGASQSLAATMQRGAEPPATQAPGAVALDSLRENLQRQLGPGIDTDHVLTLLQAVRDLAATHGPAAIRHCLQVVESTAALLGRSAVGEATP
jgi:hypothetical protein